VDSALTLRFTTPEGLGQALDALLAHGWATKGSGWFVVPLGEDISEWRAAEMGPQELHLLLRSKHQAGEPFGVRLWWSATEIGGEFLFFPDGSLVLSPSMNRVLLAGRTTNVSWYLERVLSAFADKGIVEDWTWQETA
jgi:hypothetical protein